MKSFLFFIFLFSVSCCAQAQQQYDSILAVTGNEIYSINMNTGNINLLCTTGNLYFFDIAQTPDGKIWGNTTSALYEIFPNGQTNYVGAVSIAGALVGLNDSTLLIDSSQYLLSINTSNASTRVIGYTGCFADGDLTWLGKNLYMIGRNAALDRCLIKITLDSNYSQILNVDTIRNAINPYNPITPALTSAYIDSVGYTLLAIPYDSTIYKIDTLDASYELLSHYPQLGQIAGASSMIFPPDPPKPPTGINEIGAGVIQVNAYPNPAMDDLSIVLENFEGEISDAELQLYDYTGRLTLQQNMHATKETVHLKSLPAGLYFLELKYHDQNIFSQKIIKQ
jgi:hypothetical protein